jgi:hypothetical protein
VAYTKGGEDAMPKLPGEDNQSADVELFLALVHIKGMLPDGEDLFCSISAVQHLFCMANHKKVLHLGGAQDFQSLFQGSKVMEPKNITL